MHYTKTPCMASELIVQPRMSEANRERTREDKRTRVRSPLQLPPPSFLPSFLYSYIATLTCTTCTTRAWRAKFGTHKGRAATSKCIRLTIITREERPTERETGRQTDICTETGGTFPSWLRAWTTLALGALWAHAQFHPCHSEE